MNFLKTSVLGGLFILLPLMFEDRTQSVPVYLDPFG